MLIQLRDFYIYKLWGEKTVHLHFVNNRLILVGENGSGKTTILRIVYETLACKWAQLSVEDFSKITISFANGKSKSILKSDIENAKDLFVELDAPIIRDLPPIIRRALRERYEISGRSISYDQIIELLHEYDYPDQELIARLNEKIASIENSIFAAYNNFIRTNLQCNVIYLPTYRRIEKRIGYINEKDYPRQRYQFKHGYAYSSQFDESSSIEIAKTGMDDVDYFIRNSIETIQRKADISASRLNYQCFKGILNKASSSLPFNQAILSDEEIENVFGSISENVLLPEESKQIQQSLQRIKYRGAPDSDTYEQIVYYFYSMLHERYQQITEDEKVIISFFNACNAYLRNKRFTYNQKEYSYSISVIEGSGSRTINLENLSSGEKQVVSIFSYLYLFPSVKSIILIDEPELSLSVPWQRKFLIDISNGAQCAGLISVTHSPFVFDNELKPYAHALEEFVL